jgi:hypothetical protein
MPQTITLTVPDHVLQPLQRVAQATQQPLEALLVTALESSLPSLEGLPPEVIENLTELEACDNHALRRVMSETVPRDHQKRLSDLLAVNQSGSLTEPECRELTALQQGDDLIMLRKARAAVLLRIRGQHPLRPPNLANLGMVSKPLRRSELL